MNRSVLLGLVAFAAIVAVGLMASDSTAVAGHGCHRGHHGGHHGGGGCYGVVNAGYGGGFIGGGRRHHCGGHQGHHRVRRGGLFGRRGHHGHHGRSNCCQPQPVCQPACPQPCSTGYGAGYGGAVVDDCPSCDPVGGGQIIEGGQYDDGQYDSTPPAPEAEAGEGDVPPAPEAEASTQIRRAPASAYRVVRFRR